MRASLVVWLQEKPKRSDEAMSLLIRVPFPTPDGPHITKVVGRDSCCLSAACDAVVLSASVDMDVPMGLCASLPPYEPLSDTSQSWRSAAFAISSPTVVCPQLLQLAPIPCYLFSAGPGWPDDFVGCTQKAAATRTLAAGMTTHHSR